MKSKDKKKLYCVTANVKGWFFIKAKSKKDAEARFYCMITNEKYPSHKDKRSLGLKHFTIEKVNKKPVIIDEIPF